MPPPGVSSVYLQPRPLRAPVLSALCVPSMLFLPKLVPRTAEELLKETTEESLVEALEKEVEAKVYIAACPPALGIVNAVPYTLALGRNCFPSEDKPPVAPAERRDPGLAA